MRCSRALGVVQAQTVLSTVTLTVDAALLDPHHVVRARSRQIWCQQELLVDKVQPVLEEEALTGSFEVMAPGTYMKLQTPDMAAENLSWPIRYMIQQRYGMKWVFPFRESFYNPKLKRTLAERYKRDCGGEARDVATQYDELRRRSKQPLTCSVEDLMNVYSGGRWTLDMVRCVLRHIIENEAYSLRHVRVTKCGAIISECNPRTHDERLRVWQALLMGFQMLAQVPPTPTTQFKQARQFFLNAVARVRAGTELLLTWLQAQPFLNDAPRLLPFPVLNIDNRAAGDHW